MTYPCEKELETLSKMATDLNVLDIGTGLGHSANALAVAAESVTTIENNSDWYGKAELSSSIKSVFGDWRDIGQNFDLVFIDHFPLPDRLPAAAHFLEQNALVLLHDGDLLRRAEPYMDQYLRQFERLEGQHGMYLLRRSL
jgi:predicted O-methyltransferase YrrM